MLHILPLSQSTFCSWGVDMSWLCSVCQKSFSRKDSIQRHLMSTHRKAGLTPFQTVPMFSQKCQRFRFRASFHLHYRRNDLVRKNGLGSISIATSFRDHLPSPGEDRLVLFTMAARVYRNASRHATHWIRQGNCYGFGAGCNNDRHFCREIYSERPCF